tara:strand:+ start:1282 stop:1992 length:711 start_codon:yes stop_codon:yes gene_type:complete
MRIAVSGTANQGKTTLIKDFIDVWKPYSTPEETYRSKLKKGKHSKQTTSDTQWDILNFMLDGLQEYRSNHNIIFDRCPLDNIVYSLWAHEKGADGFDKEFIDKCIPIIRESMKFLDIIFFIPITSAAPVKIEDDGVREIDHEYIIEIDNLFKAMYQQWLDPNSPFFPVDDKPAIIEIFGTREQRIHMMKLYIDPDTGKAIDEEGILDVNEMERVEQQFRNLDDGYTDMGDVKNLIV